MVIQGKTPLVSAVMSPRDAAQEKRTRMILEGPIGLGVLFIALPSVATMLLHTINGFLDRFFCVWTWNACDGCGQYLHNANLYGWLGVDGHLDRRKRPHCARRGSG